MKTCIVILVLLLFPSVWAVTVQPGNGTDLWAKIAGCSDPCVIDVPPGLYLVGDRMEVSPSNDSAWRANIVIRGAGYNTTVIRYTGPVTEDAILRWRGWSTSYTPGDKAIVGLTFDGNGKTQYALASNDAEGLTYDNLIVEGYYNVTDQGVGILVGHPRRVRITNIYAPGVAPGVLANIYTTGIWITNDKSADVLVDGFWIYNHSKGVLLEDNGRRSIITNGFVVNTAIGFRTVSGTEPWAGESIVNNYVVRNTTQNCYQIDSTTANLLLDIFCDGPAPGWMLGTPAINSTINAHFVGSPPPPVDASNVTYHLSSTQFGECKWVALHGNWRDWDPNNCTPGLGHDYHWVQINIQNAPNPTTAWNDAFGALYQDYLNLFWGGV